MALWVVILVLVGCAHRGALRMPGPTASLGGAPEPYAMPEPIDETRSRRGGPGHEIALEAARLLGKGRLVVDGERYRYDCSGFVCAAYGGAGSPLSGNTESLFDAARQSGTFHKRREPRMGDLAFFDDTYDRNGNGKRDDPLTHVAVVEDVAADGTITLIHLGNQGITRIRMNLRHPDVHLGPDGTVWNDHLRAAGRGDRGPTLTGQLWVGFGSLWALDGDALARG